MAHVVELITRLDFDALADRQLDPSRADAVRRRLEKDGGAMLDVAKIDLVNDVLRSIKPAVYRDAALREAVQALLRRRAA